MACSGEDTDEAGGQGLWQRIQTQSFRSWQRAPGWETQQPTSRAHGETAEIFINPTLAAARQQASLAAWPDGSLIVKDAQPSLIAAMEKSDGRWFYAEWSRDGAVRYAGVPTVCTNCHDAGEDQLFSLALPR
ncbi:MAG: hypothetical protein QM756_15370 [Polyangiaceae bacterium]